MTESWNVKKQMSRIKRSLSLNGLSTIDGVGMSPIGANTTPGLDQVSSKNSKSQQTGSTGFIPRTRSVSELGHTDSPIQRIYQLRNSFTNEEIKGERHYHTQLSIHRSCENLQQFHLDDSDGRSDLMETGASVSTGGVSPFHMHARSRSLTPTSPSHFSTGRSRPVYVTKPNSPILRPGSLSSKDSRKRRSFYGVDNDPDEMMDLEDTTLPASKKLLVCQSPLHISSSSPCTSPVCSSPHRKHFSSFQRPSNSSGDFPYHGNSSFSSRDGSLSSAPHSMSSDGEFDTESDLYSCSMPYESNGLLRAPPNLELTCDRKKVPTRLNLKSTEDNSHSRVRRKSSSDSLCDSALGFSDTQSNTPLSPRELKFLQYPTSSSHLPIPVPRSPPQIPPLQAMETATEQPLPSVLVGGETEVPSAKGVKWKRPQDAGAGSKTISLFRRNMSSPLVSSAFSKTSSVGGGFVRNSKPIDMEEDGYDNSTLFECREIPTLYTQLLPSNMEGEDSLGFSPSPTSN